MGLVADIKAAVELVITAVDDIAQSCSYWATGTPSYNAPTGAVTRSETEYTGVKAVFVNFSRREIDGTVIRPEDQKCLIAANDLSVTPTVNDRIIDAASVSWEVVNIRKDSAGALWTLRVRRP